MVVSDGPPPTHVHNGLGMRQPWVALFQLSECSVITNHTQQQHQSQLFVVSQCNNGVNISVVYYLLLYTIFTYCLYCKHICLQRRCNTKIYINLQPVRYGIYYTLINKCDWLLSVQLIIGVSLSEPHSSDVNGDFV